MEEVAVAVAEAPVKANLAGTERQKNNKIQVSSTKKPLYFYVNLAKRYMQQHEEVELSALGMAITTVVTIAEILKNNGVATQKKIMTSTVGMKDESKGRLVQKAKIEILLVKTDALDDKLTTKTMTSEVAADDKEETTPDGKEKAMTSEVVADGKEETSEVAADGKEETSEVAADGKEETSEVAADGKEETSEVVADGKEETSEVAADGKEERSEVVADGKEETMTSEVAADGKEETMTSEVAADGKAE